MTDVQVGPIVRLVPGVQVADPIPLSSGAHSTTPVEVVVGPQGPPGAAGSSSVITQDTPASTWTLANPVGHACLTTVYVGGEVVDADVAVTPSWITVTFATPQSGVVVVG